MPAEGFKADTAEGCAVGAAAGGLNTCSVEGCRPGETRAAAARLAVGVPTVRPVGIAAEGPEMVGAGTKRATVAAAAEVATAAA